MKRCNEGKIFCELMHNNLNIKNSFPELKTMQNSKNIAV